MAARMIHLRWKGKIEDESFAPEKEKMYDLLLYIK